MGDVIEITIRRLPGGATTAVSRVMATATLVEVDGGHGIYVRVIGPTVWERRGFIAGDGHEEIWRLVAKAAAWGADEAEKLS
ncbi:hypothetical protein MXD81_50175 [Microbacteriaceae bacterium K1510]|nr:hypothetical protein [Microbacteriaceae bacterium K1510]